ncbi:MAG: BamA/TamA family outer membrane protein [Deltaproteobacteria bacterium]|nr:BamA/TamA family outer membrane protein [Deltaproteobacteria bacterium]
MRLRLLSALVAAALSPPVLASAQPQDAGPDTGAGATEELAPAVTWTEEPTEAVLSGTWAAPEEDGRVPGPKYALQKIEIKGNDKTMRSVISRYVEIEPGEVFAADDPRLVRARYRMLASGLFYDVQLYLKRGDKRGWVVLVVDVKERNTIVVQDIMAGFSEITPYGSLDVADRSFLGSGISVSAAVVAAADQYGYRLRFNDSHFLDSDFGLHFEGLYAHARDYFGREHIQVESSTGDSTRDYAILRYDRAGGRLGTGYTMLGDNFFSLDYRFEIINADVPVAGSNYSFGETRPIEFGHLLPGHSILSALSFGVLRDTRDSTVLPSEGARTAFDVELSTEVLGSDYEYSKFTLAYDHHFPLRSGHSIKLHLFAGLIMGDAPFFDQFFVGDFSAFVPARVLEMNFSHLAPSVLGTTIKEMRYEDLAGSIGLEYSLPFYRGQGFFYAVNGFVGLGVFALCSREDLRTDPKGYTGFQVVPMDLTADLGVRVDTEIGLFVFSFANLVRLIPDIGEEMAE